MKTRKKTAAAIGQSRSRKKPMPEIYVGCEIAGSRGGLARAHLQNSGGYLYLVWREGSTVERRYLGKAGKSSTTRGPRRRPGPREELAPRRWRVGRPV
jgi:hypothetical protein